MKIIGYLIFTILIASLLMSFSFFRKKNYIDVAVEIRNKVGKELAKKHRMDVIAMGGAMMDQVSEIALSFQMYRLLTQDEARTIMVDCSEAILKAFNENEAIRPYLSNYPFTPSNLDVTIYIFDPTRHDVYYPDFCIVSVDSEDFVSFKRENPQGKRYPPIMEPYQEALLKVKQMDTCQKNI
jgi:hypothetical protein